MNRIAAFPETILAATPPEVALMHVERRRLSRFTSNCTSQIAALLIAVSIHTHAAGTTIAC